MSDVNEVKAYLQSLQNRIVDELETLDGEAGNFTATIRQRGRYVTDACTRCGECTQACPVILPNEFDSGMAARKAIYTPIPQSVPGTYLVDLENCLNDPPNYLPCDRCVQVCPPKSIDFLMPRESIETLQVSAIIVAPNVGRFGARRSLLLAMFALSFGLFGIVAQDIAFTSFAVTNNDFFGMQVVTKHRVTATFGQHLLLDIPAERRDARWDDHRAERPHPRGERCLLV